MKNIASRLLATAVLGLFAGTSAFAAPTTVVDFGESTTYVTSSQNLAAGNGSFTTSTVSPAADYAGPTFWGGIVYNVGGGAATWQLADNYSSAGSNDAIRGARSSMAIGDSATYAFMFNGSQTFSIDNTTDSSFYLNARRDGGQTGANTGIRWMLRDTGGNYYVSALNNSTAAQYGSAYSGSSGVTQTTLFEIDWFNYTFASGAVGSAIADTSTFFGSTQFNAAGFQYTAARVSGAGGLDMSFADFTVTAIPEPSSLVLLGLAGLCAGLFARRRR